MSKINYKKIFTPFISFVFLLIPLFIFAQGSGVETIQNPLGEGNDSVEAILLKIMSLVSMLGGIVVVFFIIYSGFKIVTAGDNESERTKAKDMFYATVIGGAILLGAGIIASVVVGTINAIKTP